MTLLKSILDDLRARVAAPIAHADKAVEASVRGKTRAAVIEALDTLDDISPIAGALLAGQEVRLICTLKLEAALGATSPQKGGGA